MREPDVHAFNHVMYILEERRDEYLSWLKVGGNSRTAIEAINAINTLDWLVPAILKNYEERQKIESRLKKECEPVLEA